VASGIRPAPGLSDAHLALVGAIADTIIPRTTTPGATDVGVPAFIDIIVSENYADAARTGFVAGLSALGAGLESASGVAFIDQSPEQRAVSIGSIERVIDRRSEPSSTYWRLKGLVLHGFFTSEPIMTRVLGFDMMPGKFDGSAPMLGT
jgi:glucoside 3-dehydrogenase (cytochrome c) hitch-hiker subunit